MKIDILTIFPEMFDGFLNTSIIKRAIQQKFVNIEIHDIRKYSKKQEKLYTNCSNNVHNFCYNFKNWIFKPGKYALSYFWISRNTTNI